MLTLAPGDLMTPEQLGDPAPTETLEEGMDPRRLPSSEQVVDCHVRRTVVFAFAAVAETSDNRYYRRNGPSANALIPRGVGYPTIGPYLGYLQAGLSILPSVQKEPTPKGNSPMDHTQPVRKEALTVSSHCGFNNERDIDKYLRVLPGGPWDSMSDYGGGALESEDLYCNLLLVMVNVNRWKYPGIKKYLECWLFFRGQFEATPREYGGFRNGQDEALPLVFTALADDDPSLSGCLRLPGMQTYHHWYEDNLTGEYINPKWQEYGGHIWPRQV